MKKLYLQKSFLLPSETLIFFFKTVRLWLITDKSWSFQVPTLPDDLGREVLCFRNWWRIRWVQDWWRHDRRRASKEYNGGQERRRIIRTTSKICCDKLVPHVVNLLDQPSLTNNQVYRKFRAKNQQHLNESTKRFNF